MPNEKDALKNTSRYLRFSLGKEEFALELLLVREVIAPPKITPVPQSSAQLLGLFSLRGSTIPVFDLRARLGITPHKNPEESVIICDFGNQQVGLVVDSINSVIQPSAGEVTNAPDLKNQKAMEYIDGVYQLDGALILLLDVRKVFRNENLAAIGDPKNKRDAA